MLSEAIDQLLEDEPEMLSDAELHELVIDLMRQSARLGRGPGAVHLGRAPAPRMGL